MLRILAGFHGVKTLQRLSEPVRVWAMFMKVYYQNLQGLCLFSWLPAHETSQSPEIALQSNGAIPQFRLGDYRDRRTGYCADPISLPVFREEI